MKNLLTIIFLIITSGISAQVTKNISFDQTQFPSLGWTTGKLNGTDVNNYVERVTAGNSPACAPHSGSGMLRYRSGFMFNPGEQTLLISQKYDLTNNPGTAVISFWLFKSNINTIKDSVTVYINNTASIVNAAKVIGPVSRDSGGFSGWKKYSGIIPSGFNTSSAYLIFVFTNRETNGIGANIYLDDVSIQTFPKPEVLISSSIFFQETSDISKGQNDQVIIGIKVNVDGAGDSLKVDSIVTNGNGCSNLNSGVDVLANGVKVWFTKGTNTFISSAGFNQFGNSTSLTSGRIKFTQPNFFLENGDNYFWLTYSTPATAISGDYLDADFLGIYYRKVSYTGADTSRAPLQNSLQGARLIEPSLCNGVIPTLTIGTSWQNGSYTFNDFINRVYLKGENSFTPSYPYIDNSINAAGPMGVTYSTPFTVHPPDYEKLPLVSSNLSAQPHTTAVLSQGKTYATPSLVAGNTVGQGLGLQCGTWSSSNYVAAWIDFNKDNDMLDPGEQVMNSTGLSALTWSFVPLNVPNLIGSSTANINSAAAAPGIVFGNVTMRVREVFANNNIQPCQSGYSFGETEDYTISIIPSTCPSGVKLWLGYTDDWSNSGNWCGGVPTISDIAVIDEAGFLGGTQTGAPFEPVIHTGTIAKAKTIRISGTDTLTIDAQNNSSLQIADSLNISYNTPANGGGSLIIKSAFADTAQLSNGGFTNLITPFQGNKKNCRMQLIYDRTELLAKGLIAGDYIDQLIFHIRLRAAPSPVSQYSNFTVKYATVDSTWAGWTAPPTYLAPNTSPYITVFNPSTVVLPMAAGTSGDLMLNLTSKMYWNGVSDLVLEICYDNSLIANGDNVDQMSQTQTPLVNKTMWLNNNGGPLIAGCTLNWPTSGSTTAVTAQFRPNITFHYVRSYAKFPINITGNGATTAGTWLNNGVFVHGNSNVTFNNGSQNQEISGADVTTFNKLTINKNGNHGVILENNANVDSFLVMTKGYLSLNQKVLTVSNPMTNAIQRTGTAYILSENNPSAYGYLEKNISTTTGTHLFPFGNSTGQYIPFSINLTAGDIGYVKIATYHTAQNNTPYANNGTVAGTVTHLLDNTTGNDLSVQNVADRFWQINKSGPSGTAGITFTITTPERPAGAGSTDNTLKAQRWENPNINGNAGWDIFNLNTFTHVASTNKVTMNNMTTFDGPWVLSNVAQPLGEQLPCSLPVSITASKPSICKGDSSKLTAGGASFYSWAPANGLSGTSGNIVYAFPAVTTTYTVTGTDASGCVKSVSKKVTVLNTPPVTITPVSSSICPGNAQQITASGATGFYSWSPSTGLNTTSGSTVLAGPSSTTTYSVTGTNANGCTSTRTSKINVTCSMTVGLTINNITGTTADVSWNSNPCATGYKLQYRVSGTTAWTIINMNSNPPAYSITGLALSTSYEWKVATRCLTSVYSAFSPISSFTTNVMRQNNETAHTIQDLISVFPNPATSSLQIEFNSETDGNGRLTLQNALGQILYEKQIVITDGIYADKLDLMNVAPGIYVIKIEKNNVIKFANVIKQ